MIDRIKNWFKRWKREQRIYNAYESASIAATDLNDLLENEDMYDASMEKDIRDAARSCIYVGLGLRDYINTNY